MLAIGYNIALAVALLVLGWFSTGRYRVAPFERAILAGAAVVLSISAAIAVSFWAFRGLQAGLIFPLGAVLTWLLGRNVQSLSKINKSARRTRQRYQTVVLILMIGVACLGLGRQFQYQSAWGDVGSYLLAAQHYRHGGKVTFEYKSRGHALSHPDKPLPLTGVIMDEAGTTQQFHALPGWPGWMALFGTQSHPAAILPLLFAFAVGAFYFLAVSIFGLSRATLLPTIGLAILPVAWFQSLYATSEMLALCIMLGTLLLATVSRSGFVAIAVGIFAFGSTHISLIVLAPLVAATLVVCSVVNVRPKHWASSTALAATCAGAGAVLFSFHVAGTYTANITHSVFMGRSWLVWIAIALPIIAIATDLSVTTSALIRRAFQSTVRIVCKNARTITLVIAGVVIIIALAQGYLLGWTQYFMPHTTSIYVSTSARSAYVNMGFESVLHLSMLNLFGASALIGLLAFFGLPFVTHRRKSERELALWFACAYLVIAYGLGHVDVTNNYYMSRYFVPVAVPMLLLLSVPWLERLGRAGILFLLASPLAAFYIASMLFHGFFVGDRSFVARINRLLGNTSAVYVSGSRQLRYLVGPSLMESAHTSAYRATDGAGREGTAAAVLLTDNESEAGSHARCVSEVQRRIPWQIGYLTAPEAVPKTVCVAPLPTGPTTIGTGIEHWIVNGNMTFPITRPSGAKTIMVQVHSDGWWAHKAPFADLHSLRPTLEVCGHPFQLTKLSPKLIVFTGEMKEPVCDATLETATFVPAKIGDGHDARHLGIDLNKIVVVPTHD